MRRFLAFPVLPLIAFACSGTTTTIPGGANDGGPSNDAAGDAPSADSGGGACDGGSCSIGLQCCGTACVNESNDPNNCGGCGIVCSGSTSMCFGSRCRAPTCNPACGDGYECCDIQGPGPSGPPRCVQGTTCPVGCPACG